MRDESFRSDLGRRLRKIRQQKKLKQKEAAARLNISEAYLSLIERGHRAVSIELLIAFSRVYKVDVQRLIFEESQSYEKDDRAYQFFNAVFRLPESERQTLYNLVFAREEEIRRGKL